MGNNPITSMSDAAFTTQTNHLLSELPFANAPISVRIEKKTLKIDYCGYIVYKLNNATFLRQVNETQMARCWKKK